MSTALRRYDIAHGKAYGALAMGVGSKTLGLRAVERPHFLAAVNGAIGGAMVPVAGGVLVRIDGEIVGCVGVTGDSSDNDDFRHDRGLPAGGSDRAIRVEAAWLVRRWVPARWSRGLMPALCRD